MRLVGRLTLGSLALAAGNVAALAQSVVISARSGLIHYVEGQVYLGDQAVETKFGIFPEVKENQQLKTEEGRAEVLLTPGVFLRLGENSSFRMITNRLIDTRLEFLSGSAVVEAEDFGKDNSVTVVYKDATRASCEERRLPVGCRPAELRVFDGSAEVTSGDETVEVKEGHVDRPGYAGATQVRQGGHRRAKPLERTARRSMSRWLTWRRRTLCAVLCSAASMLTGGARGNGMFGSRMVLQSVLRHVHFCSRHRGNVVQRLWKPLVEPVRCGSGLRSRLLFLPWLLRLRNRISGLRRRV